MKTTLATLGIQVCLILCLITLLIACFETRTIPGITSTSVTTGNPTGLTISFTQGSLPVKISGRVDIFASTQIPVPGFQPNPLISLSIDSAQNVTLDSLQFRNIPDSLWPRKSIEGDSIYRFNAIITGDKQGLIMKNFGYRKNAGDFALRVEDSDVVWSKKRAMLTADLLPLESLRCLLDSNMLSRLQNHYLFIYGTGFVAKGNSGEFRFPAVPKGNQDIFLMSLLGPEHPSSETDSTYIYTMIKSSNSENDSLVVKNVFDRIRLPDSLIQK